MAQSINEAGEPEKRVIYADDEKTDCEADPDSLLACLLHGTDMVELFYSLHEDEPGTLPSLGPERELIWAPGGEEVLATVTETGKVVFERPEHLDLQEAADMDGSREKSFGFGSRAS